MAAKRTHQKVREKLLNGRTERQYFLEDVLIAGKFIRGYKLKKALLVCGFIENLDCQLCGWNKTNPHSGIIATQIDHVDGDDTNNKPENLKILCPNCHSLTKTYAGNNKVNQIGAIRVPCNEHLFGRN